MAQQSVPGSERISRMPALPAHEHWFTPNMALGYSKDGYRAIVNVFNYYNKRITPDNFESDAIAEFAFYDEDGDECFVTRHEVAPCGSVHVDLGDALAAAGHSREKLGCFYVRLIPLSSPPAWSGRRISTEYTAEIVSPIGSRTFFHSTASCVRIPSVQRMRTGQLFADAATRFRYLVLANNYFGPRWPYFSEGWARITITNHRGEKRVARSEPVPARGMKLFPMEDAFPDLAGFLDGRSGQLYLQCCNLLRKPWAWLSNPADDDSISIEHL